MVAVYSSIRYWLATFRAVPAERKSMGVSSLPRNWYTRPLAMDRMVSRMAVMATDSLNLAVRIRITPQTMVTHRALRMPCQPMSWGQVLTMALGMMLVRATTASPQRRLAR